MRHILILILILFILKPIMTEKVLAKKENRIVSKIEKKEVSATITLTIYNPTKSQCDDSPLLTANNTKIDTAKLKKGELHWIALSRNLLKRFKGDFNYGDTILLQSGDNQIDGKYVIQDTMNKRFKNYGDILVHGKKYKGKWKNVKITKL